jgi:hypothetical protein
MSRSPPWYGRLIYQAVLAERAHAWTLTPAAVDVYNDSALERWRKQGLAWSIVRAELELDPNKP